MNSNTNFEAMRNALNDGPPGEWKRLRSLRLLNPRVAAQSLYWGMALLSRQGVACGGLRKETISWRVHHNGWAGVRWVTVTEYAPGFIRLRNDVIADIPKDVWAYSVPQPGPRQFELTFHWKEVTDELGVEVFRFCNAMASEEFHYNWPRFQAEDTYPQYAWSRLARLAYEKGR